MQTIGTDDGRIWGYRRSGRADGRPVLVHHGLIGDASLGPVWARLGETAGLEWIVIERPGYGGTPPMAMNRVADWTDLIAPVLEALGVTGRFDVIGISAGAPYAYALAAGMPERVGRACILSGVPFIGSAGVLAAYSNEAQVAYARYRSQDDNAMRAEFRAFCEDVGGRIGDNDEVSGALAAILSHDAAGPAREAQLQARDWGFGRSAIACPVDLWHSEADDMVPFAAARLSAEGLPNAVWHTQAEPSHFASDTTLKQMAQILSSAGD